MYSFLFEYLQIEGIKMWAGIESAFAFVARIIHSIHDPKKKPSIRLRRLSDLFGFIPPLGKLSSV